MARIVDNKVSGLIAARRLPVIVSAMTLAGVATTQNSNTSPANNGPSSLASATQTPMKIKTAYCL